MAVNKRLIGAGATGSAALVPSEHFGVVLYEGDGSTSHSINGGKFGAGGYFNGSNGKITTPLILKSLGSDNFTISLWAYFNSIGAGGNSQTLYEEMATSGSRNVVVQINSSGKVRALANNGSNNEAISTATLTTNTWYHIVFSYSTTNGGKIYINNSADGTSSYVSLDRASHTLSAIGARPLSGGSNFVDGKLDQFRIFQKELSSSEVSTLYAETASTVESLDPLSEDTTDTLQVLGDSSCVATYRFENNEDDLSGNYDGTGTEMQYAAGRYGQAAVFNGANDMRASSFYSSTLADVTVSGWFNFSNSNDGWVGNNSGSLFSLGQSNGNVAGNNVCVRLAENSSTFNIQSFNNDVAITMGNSSPSQGQWFHIALSYNSTTDKWRVYLNGNYEGESSAVTYNFGSSEFRVGSGIQGTGTFHFQGKADQVRIFNKVLSASEVTTLYNENSLVASYRFEGNANDDMRTYDGTASNVTYEYGLGFQPDLIWAKARDRAGEWHMLSDSTRGTNSQLFSNATNAQDTKSTVIQSFDTGGFTVGSDALVNNNGTDYVAWCLKANGGTTSSNTDGTITSTVQANQDAGFSIVKYTGVSGGGSWGHGLTQEPEYIIFKRYTSSQNWFVFVKINNVWHYIEGLNTTSAAVDYSSNMSSSSTTITLPNLAEFNNDTGSNYIAYCFNSVDSLSKFGSYTGTGGNLIVETGFEPAFLMIKRTDAATYDWYILDNKRNPVDYRNTILRANAGDAEQTVTNGDIDVKFLSNGFAFDDIPTSSGGFNASGGTYLYMAFAADPDTEQPTVAKSFSTVAYTGNSTTKSITGLGFSPNLLWIKNRDTTQVHILQDTIRGAGFSLTSNATNSTFGTANDLITSFDNDGFTVNRNYQGGTTNNSTNGSYDFVAWAWKADDNEPTIYGGSALAVYKFEDNANDVRGNYNATATNITYTTGKFNKAASFVESNSSEIDFSNSIHGSSFSMSFWMKATDMGAGTTATAYSIYSAWIDVNNYFRPVLYGDGSLLLLSKYSGTFKSNLTSSGIITENTWHHIVFNFTPTDTKAYVDGVNIGTFPSYDPISFTSKAFGTDRGNPNFTGDIDQLRFYDAALTQENVTALYNETASDNDDLTLGAPGEVVISANANAGFSIVKYEGDGLSGKQVPHGLSATPEMIILKNTTDTVNWFVWTKDLGGGNKLLELNTTSAVKTTTTPWNNTVPNSTVFTVGTNNGSNGSGDNIIAYCFHSVSGYSKIGSYTGSSSNVTVTTGFRPDWVMIKSTTAAYSWYIIDSVRGATSSSSIGLFANLTNAEASGYGIYFEDTGFVVSSGVGTGTNASGNTYIYMAFKIN